MAEIKLKVIVYIPPHYARLHVECPYGSGGICKVSLGPKAIPNQVWQWDGNVDHPNITPSINCHGNNDKCGRHYTVMNGQPIPSA